MIRKDRRHAPRTASNVPLDLYDPKGRMIIGEGRFLNVSMTGSQMESRQPLQLRQPIRLQVQTGGRSPMELAGRIVWRKKKAAKFTYGIQFDMIVDNKMPIRAAGRRAGAVGLTSITARQVRATN